RAIASPMPLLAPVTIATFPFNLNSSRMLSVIGTLNSKQSPILIHNWKTLSGRLGSRLPSADDVGKLAPVRNLAMVGPMHQPHHIWTRDSNLCPTRTTHV